MRSQLVVVPALVAIAAACWLSVSCRDDELSERLLCAPVRRLAPLERNATDADDESGGGIFVARRGRPTKAFARSAAHLRLAARPAGYASSSRWRRGRGASAGAVLPGPFLAAIDEFMPVYEALGPVIKAAAVKDLAGNAVKLRRNGADRAGGAGGAGAAPASLQAMIAADLAVQNHTHPDSSAMALLWLKRILEFTVTVFEEIAAVREVPAPGRAGDARRQYSRELSDCVNAGYWRHLAPHHNQIFRHLASLVLAVVPPLAEFVGNLGHSTLASLRPELRRWCTAARVPLQGLDQFLRKERLEK